MEHKNRVFIGSSSESIKIAEIVKNELEPEYECEIWNHCFFDYNESTYDTLYRKSIVFNYAIFIGGKDDFVERISTEKTKISPRDNVYFELGLYAGILSPKRSFFLIDDSCDVATDFKGITLAMYNNEKDVVEECKKIKDSLKVEDKINRITLLPSTSLAIGYYENFVKDISRNIYQLTKIKINNKCCRVSEFCKKLIIIIPDKVESDIKQVADKYLNEKRLKKIELGDTFRKFGVMLDIKDVEESKINFIDFPTTLRIAYKSVEMIYGNASIGAQEEIKLAKMKERTNFISTLKNLIENDAYAKDVVLIEEMEMD